MRTTLSHDFDQKTFWGLQSKWTICAFSCKHLKALCSWLAMTQTSLELNGMASWTVMPPYSKAIQGRGTPLHIGLHDVSKEPPHLRRHGSEPLVVRELTLHCRTTVLEDLDGQSLPWSGAGHVNCSIGSWTQQPFHFERTYLCCTWSRCAATLFLTGNGNACLAGGIFPDRTALALTFFLTRSGFGSLVLTAFMAARDQWEATSVKKSTEGTCLLLQCAMWRCYVQCWTWQDRLSPTLDTSN